MRIFIGFFLQLAIGWAHASVVYHWQTVDTAGYADPGINGMMAIADSAWRQGSIGYVHTPTDTSHCASPDCLIDPNAPIDGFSFFGRGAGLFQDYHLGLGFLFRAIGEYDLTFGDFATGSLRVDNGETAVTMASTGNLWTISFFDSDGAHPCGPTSRCAGITGRWALDQSTVPVPEPSSMALVLLAFAAAAIVRARSRPM